MKTCRAKFHPGHRAAFTLIELLVVIAIIAVLAGIVISGIGAINRQTKISKVKASLTKIATAIEAYKAAVGTYPPENPTRSDRSSLYYELLGMVSADGSSYSTADGRDTLLPAQINAAFGVGGIQNASRTPAPGNNHLSKLGISEHREDPAGPAGIQFLVAPVKGTHPTDPAFNPVHYMVRNPSNNPKTFDIWFEVIISGTTPTVIGNWK